jgi:serine-type D-Ala-D-Ala carboxypeptidase/endopeptidase
MRLLTRSLLVAVAALPVSAQQPAIISDSAIRAIIKDRVDAKLSAGIVVGVVEPNGQRRVVSYGVSGTARPLDANTVFEIGSITKTFTSGVLAEMAARGEVRLDDPVARYLPATVKIPSRGGKQITLQDLATQSSGLPRMPNNFRPADPTNPYADYTAEQMYAFLSGYELRRDIGAEYEYSNLGVGLLGHALTLRSGLSLEQMYRRYLLDPLGMNDTRIALTPDMRARLALGHNESGDVVPNWDVGMLGGAGSLRSTVSDMLTYLAANIAADLDSTRKPLGPALHATHVRRRPAGSMGIGLGWHLRSTPDSSLIVWHNGGTGGYRTFAGYDPARRTGVVVLTNSNIGADDIGFYLLSPSIPLRPPKLPAWVGRKEIVLPPEVLDRYVGEYELTPAFHIVVERDGNGLVVTPTGQGRARIFAEREGEFFLRAVDAQISFQTDASGKVTGLVLHQNGRDQPAAKIR